MISAVKEQYGGVLPPFERGLPVKARLTPASEEATRQFFIKMQDLLSCESNSDSISHIIDLIEKLLKLLGPAFMDCQLDAFGSLL